MRNELKEKTGSIQSELSIIKRDIAHLEKETLLRFDHVNIRLTHLENHLSDPQKLSRLEARVAHLENRT